MDNDRKAFVQAAIALRNQQSVALRQALLDLVSLDGFADGNLPVTDSIVQDRLKEILDMNKEVGRFGRSARLTAK